MAPAAFARAQELARKARAIDARLYLTKRKTALTHRQGGFEVRLLAFYDGAELVKVVGEFPYIPPLVDTSFYFEQGSLIVEHSILVGVFDEQGNMSTEVRTSFYEARGEIWNTDPKFDPAKVEPRDGAALFREIKKALADPSYHVAEGTL